MKRASRVVRAVPVAQVSDSPARGAPPVAAGFGPVNGGCGPSVAVRRQGRPPFERGSLDTGIDPHVRAHEFLGERGGSEGVASSENVSRGKASIQGICVCGVAWSPVGYDNPRADGSAAVGCVRRCVAGWSALPHRRRRIGCPLAVVRRLVDLLGMVGPRPSYRPEKRPSLGGYLYIVLYNAISNSGGPATANCARLSGSDDALSCDFVRR